MVLMGVVISVRKLLNECQKGLNSLRELCLDWKIKTDLKSSVRMWTGLVWLKMGSSAEHLIDLTVLRKAI